MLALTLVWACVGGLKWELKCAVMFFICNYLCKAMANHSLMGMGASEIKSENSFRHGKHRCLLFQCLLQISISKKCDKLKKLKTSSNYGSCIEFHHTQLTFKSTNWYLHSKSSCTVKVIFLWCPWQHKLVENKHYISKVTAAWLIFLPNLFLWRANGITMIILKLFWYYSCTRVCWTQEEWFS